MEEKSFFFFSQEVAGIHEKWSIILEVSCVKYTSYV